MANQQIPFAYNPFAANSTALGFNLVRIRSRVPSVSAQTLIFKEILSKMKRNLFFLFVLSFFTFSASYAQQVCLNKAWDALDAKDYKNAIKYCDECIQTFGESARKMQTGLEKAGNTDKSFPVGGVNEKTKEKIFKNWAVNDVSTAYYIKGLAAKKLYQSTSDNSYKEKAEESLRETCSLSLGRCWDPQGWFWSPCAAARDELAEM